jgi:hypothetical protein
MTAPDTPKPHDDRDESGVADVRPVREKIAAQHGGNLAEHAAESNRIAEALREKLGLGPVVQPPLQQFATSGTGG